MLSKWFKRKSVPTNNGNSVPSRLGNQRYLKVFELELSNMEDTPVYTLTHQLTIGSEIGNIIISDPSVSPRHATFILQDEVISLLDHGSISGTFVNGKKIPSGKYIILEESDVILVGDLEIRIREGRASVEEQVEEEIEEEEKRDEIEETPPEVEEIPEEKPKYKPEIYVPKSKSAEAPAPKPKAVPPKKKSVTKKKNLALTSRPKAANALVRVLALVGDLLVSYAALVVFTPFDDFRESVAQIPSELIKLLPLDLNSFWGQVEQNFGALTFLLTDLFASAGEIFDFVPLLVTFVVFRLISVLIFGVSFSQYFMGIKALGNPLWARVGGLLRGILGLFTWPFLIFDAPSILSKRTFKEVITFTHLELRSKFISIFGIALYLPLTIMLVLFSPLFQGLEFPEQIIITETPEKRVKLKKEAAGTEEAIPESPVVSAQSEKLNLVFTYKPDELTLIPDFNFKSTDNKLKVNSSILFFQRELQRYVELEIFKTFDLKQLLSIGLKGNFFLQEKYPQLNKFIHTPEAKRTPFKTTVDEKGLSAFGKEFIQYTKAVFSLAPETVLEVMKDETPFIEGLMNFRSSLLSLIEYKEFNDLGFIKIGNLTFMKISYIKQKPFDLLIPLTPGEGKILKVSFETKESLSTVSSKFYKFNLENADWLPDRAKASAVSLTALGVFDLFSSDKYKELLQSTELAQSLYGFYFEKSSDLLRKGGSVELQLWKSKITQLLALLEAFPTDNKVGEGENTRLKLMQNFRDLLDALENNNFEYFGLSTTV